MLRNMSDRIPVSLPNSFVDRMRALLGEQAEAFFAAYERPPETGLRVNLLKLRPEDIRQMVDWKLDPVPWCPSGFYVDDDARPGRHPYHAAGLYYLQEPSAMAVAEALDVRPGQRVIDLAAAPGGKTTHIAALMHNDGLLVANEVDRSRIKALGENLERWGARVAVITNDTPDRLADQLGPIFDRVLLDAPCSGEGMFRKSAIARAEWSVEHVQGCAIRQQHILDHAARLVQPGGLLVYSTCTFAPEENEARITYFLDTHPDWQIEPVPYAAGFDAGQPTWVDPPRPELARTVRLWPHHLRGEGHFVARLRHGSQADDARATLDRSDQVARGNRRLRHDSGAHAAEAALQAWRSFERDWLRIELPADRIAAHGDQVYLLPADLPSFGDLRVVRAGWWLGTSRPGRFEPSHALALALAAGDAQSSLVLDQEQAERYLRGETLDHPGPDGWIMITIDGWPLGWGRRVRGTIKNFYPKGLRRNQQAAA